MTIYYFTPERAIDEHDWVIKNSGGINGTLSNAYGRIESILEHIKNDDYYPSFEDKLVHLLYSIVMNHIFIDGNKRTALVLSTYLLEINGYEYIIKDFMIIMEDIVVKVASRYVSKELLKIIVVEIIESGELSESTKLTLFETYSN